MSGEDGGEEEFAGQLEHGDGGEGGGENSDCVLDNMSRKEENVLKSREIKQSTEMHAIY